MSNTALARTANLAKMFVNLEGVHKNLRLVPGHFSPTSGPASAMDYLERKLLRFQGLIWCINHFCILSSCREIVKNAKVPIFGNFLFCKKAQKKRQVERLEILCNGPMSWDDTGDIVMDDGLTSLVKN